MKVTLQLANLRWSYSTVVDGIDDALETAFLIGTVVDSHRHDDEESISIFYNGHVMSYCSVWSARQNYVKDNFFYVVCRGLVVYASYYHSDCERFVQSFDGDLFDKHSICEFPYYPFPRSDNEEEPD